MKVTHALLPVLALAGSAFVLLRQQRGAAVLEREIRNLEVVLKKAESSPPPPADSGSGGGSRETTKESGPAPAGGAPGDSAPLTLAEFTELARKARRQDQGVPDFRSMMQIQTRMAAMDAEALSAVLEESVTADLPPGERNNVQSMVLGSLAQKDPVRAVTVGMEVLEANTNADSASGWIVSNAFKSWAAKDAAGAAAWYDAQTAAGRLENKGLDEVNDRRVRFETGLAGALLETDPAAAQARLEKLTPAEQKSVLQQSYDLPVTPAAQSAYAGLVKNLAAGEERTRLLADYGSHVGRTGLEEVNGYMDRIQASPEERQAIAVSATAGSIEHGQKITVENSTEWRQWLEKNTDADKGGAALGNVLGRASQSGDGRWAEVSALLPELSPPGQQDQVTAAFLKESGWRARGPEALKLAESIRDEPLRAEILEYLKKIAK